MGCLGCGGNGDLDPRGSVAEIVPVVPEPVPVRGGPWTEELILDSAPFDEPGVPSAIVHASPYFAADEPLRLAVFLHGWEGCTRQLAYAGTVRCRDGDEEREGWGLDDVFDDANGGALFVVVQLAYLRRSGSPGRFVERGRFATFVDELLAALEPRLGRRLDHTQLASISLLAHSAGYETAIAILARGELEVRDVVLFDALYAGEAAFAEWVTDADERRLFSIYVPGAPTQPHTRQLLHYVHDPIPGRDILSLDDARELAVRGRRARVVAAATTVTHSRIPERLLPSVLPPLGLALPVGENPGWQGDER